MALYILRRLVALLLSLTVLSVIVFSLMHVAPGGPFSYEQNMPDYMMQNIARKYGLDRPVYEQYLSWLGGVIKIKLALTKIKVLNFFNIYFKNKGKK